jgi:hypothetical protein
MPGHLGADENNDGLIDYANSAAEFKEEEDQRKGFEVDFTVRRDLCEKDATYTWASTAGTIVASGGKGCEVSQRFQSEGEYQVQLSIWSPAGRTARFDRMITVQDWLVVSIGDSVASGEGNPDRPGKLLPGGNFRAGWESARCHRSAKAGPAQAALALEAADRQTTTTFVHLACSGAEIGRGLLGEYAGIEVDKHTKPPLLPPQVHELEEIAAVRHVDAVLLSIGANDVYFGPIVKFCLQETRCMKKTFNPPAGDPGSEPLPAGPLEEVVPEALARLPGAYEQLAEKLRGGESGEPPMVSPSHVVIVDYFDPTRDSKGNFCKRIGAFNPFGWGQIDREEAKWAATELLEPLNATLSEAATRAGWTEVKGIAEAFREHGYCADESWIVHITESLLRQHGMTVNSLFTGGFHPNEAGHRQEGAMIGLTLSRVLYGKSLVGAADNTTVVTVDRHKKGRGDGDDDTERIGGIALGVVILLLGVAAGIVSRRRRGLDDEALGQRDAEERFSTPRPETGPDPESVRAYGALVENQNKWVHRRVESIEIVDERIVRRRISVDFTPAALPGLPRAKFAPIALLSKQVLSRFDLRDEAGRSLPLATSTENAEFAAEHMLQIAAEVTGEPPSARLRKLCWQVARGEPGQAWAAVEEIASGLEPETARTALKKSDRFRAATTTFASSFAVMVEIDDPERRRVVKFAYDQLVIQRLTWRQRLGIHPVSIGIELPELGDAKSRHLEFVRSAGLEYWSDRLYALRPADGSVIRRPAGSVTGDAHQFIAGMHRGTPAFARVLLRAARSGILRAGPALAGLSAIALTCAWFALPGLAGDSPGGIASILLALPAAFGAFLGSRHSHPLESAMLTGARMLVFVAGALAFTGAAALALTSSVGVLRVVLGAVALLSWASFAALTVTALAPLPPARK